MQNKRFIQTAGYYSLIFMANSGYFTYISLFYGEAGISAGQIGILTSMGAIVGILVNPFWGLRGDRSSVKNRVLLLCLLMAGCTIWLMPLAAGHFWPMLLATCIFYFFQSPVNPMSDAISLELASRENFRFSHVRTAGSLGFAAMSVVVGSLVEYHINTIFAMYTLLMFVALFVFLRLPAVQGHPRPKHKVQFWQVLKSRPLLRIYLYVLVLSSGFGFFNSFHALYSVQQGISTVWLGVCIMFGSLSQFPFMLFFDKLYNRFGIRNIVIVSGLFFILRWALYAVWLNTYTLLFLWLLHGGTFILLYLCITEYVYRHTQKELRVSGQMMNSIVLNGAGRIIGGVAGGFSAGLFGFSPIFAAASLLSMAALILFLFFTRKAEPSIQNEGDPGISRLYG